MSTKLSRDARKQSWFRRETATHESIEFDNDLISNRHSEAYHELSILSPSSAALTRISEQSDSVTEPLSISRSRSHDHPYLSETTLLEPLLGSFSTETSLRRAVPLAWPRQQSSWTSWTSSGPYGCASFGVTSKPTTIEWKGLKIQILDDSIPHYVTTARVDVSIHYINSPLYLPVPQHVDDYYGHRPVSALYSIKVGSGKLCKPVTIEIQHCSSSPAPEQLTLLRASNEREHFRPVADAVFDQRTNCGRVIVPKLDFLKDHQEYDDFSWFVIAIRWLFFRNTIYYKAQVYISKTAMMMHFIITMALDLCSTVVEAKYIDYDLHTSFPVQFDDHHRISLDIPEGGITLKSGWMIIPLYNPLITKQMVDQFCFFRNDIPKCEFSLHCERSPPARLEHRITLIGGTANGKNHFCIDFNPPLSRTCDASTAIASDQSASSNSAANTMSVPDMTRGFQGLNEHTVPKYLHDIPSEDLVGLGHTLGLRYSKLRRLKSTENFCLNLVSAWLREEDEVSERSGKPSWESLAKALEEIGQNGIARNIRESDNAIANRH